MTMIIGAAAALAAVRRQRFHGLSVRFWQAEAAVVLLQAIQAVAAIVGVDSAAAAILAAAARAVIGKIGLKFKVKGSK